MAYPFTQRQSVGALLLASAAVTLVSNFGSPAIAPPSLHPTDDEPTEPAPIRFPISTQTAVITGGLAVAGTWLLLSNVPPRPPGT